MNCSEETLILSPVEMNYAEGIADAMGEDGNDPDFPEMEEITSDDLISAAQTIRRYVYFKKTQEDDSDD
jgi:hypothetical protein